MGHLPGGWTLAGCVCRRACSWLVNIELSPIFDIYIGWLLPFNAPLLLLEDDAERREAAVQLIRIGYERLQDYLECGMAA